MRTYVPRPVNLDLVTIPEDLEDLVEFLAEHVHDVWAEQRIAEGWLYGKNRDDDEKLHPCLVPYGDLPESEREYDRNTAMSTIKLVLAQGFKISK
jgi:ryanodine receptor 2